MKLKIHVGNYEIDILHAFRENVQQLLLHTCNGCDTKMSYWLLRGFCFFLSWTEVVWFFLLKLFTHIELLTFLLVRKM